LTAYCRRLLWSPDDLEDALQSTLATLYRGFARSGEGADSARVFRVATWTCFNLNRRHRRSRAEVDPEEREPSAVDALEAECTYEEILADPRAAFDGLGDELAEACRRLNENERAILLLKALAGMTCAEIARAMDVPLGTAQGLLTRARQKLRAHLTECTRARRAGARSKEVSG
jgi:RNA polymerase sigma-70 factor (ECF subfamily)